MARRCVHTPGQSLLSKVSCPTSLLNIYYRVGVIPRPSHSLPKKIAVWYLEDSLMRGAPELDTMPEVPRQVTKVDTKCVERTNKKPEHRANRDGKVEKPFWRIRTKFAAGSHILFPSPLSLRYLTVPTPSTTWTTSHFVPGHWSEICSLGVFFQMRMASWHG
jgi:hypothetical protein